MLTAAKKIGIRLLHFIRPNQFPGSSVYWEKRYASGGNSGAGSYEEKAKFKAEYLNEFMQTYKINSVIEFGCGDGNQLALTSYDSYIGFDVSPTIIHRCIEKFSTDASKSFFLYNSYAFCDRKGVFSAELTLSLDVIYHLVEDDVFELYMCHLFNSATCHVLIYAWDVDGKQRKHVRHRKFSDWIRSNRPNWILTNTVSSDIGQTASFFHYSKTGTSAKEKEIL